MNKNVLLTTLAVLIVVALGGILLWQQTQTQDMPESKGTTNTPAQMMPTGEEHFVVLTEDGYMPSEIIIKRGDTITFSTENKDRPFWPASNVHPTHQIYSEFDPKQPVPSGQTWSFTFDDVGEWRYHDHLAPYFTGIITVTE
jgi:plastocyanin